MGGSLKFEDLQEITNRGYPYNIIKNFIETGTYKADSAILASKEYDKVYTIEIFEPLFKENLIKAEKEGIKNIIFILGDTLEQLQNIVSKVSSEGAVYFIDAHISGADSGWNQKKRVPLIEELEIILENKIDTSVFIFNDVRFWKDKVWDWSHITNDIIIQKFINKNIDLLCYFEKNDRFYVFTK